MKEFKLKTPLVFGSKSIEEIHLKEPTLRHIRSFPIAMQTIDPLIEILKKLVSNPDLPGEALDNLNIEDSFVMIEWLSGFFPQGTIGNTS